jgi:hypothetical protein
MGHPRRGDNHTVGDSSKMIPIPAACVVLTNQSLSRRALKAPDALRWAAEDDGGHQHILAALPSQLQALHSLSRVCQDVVDLLPKWLCRLLSCESSDVPVPASTTGAVGCHPEPEHVSHR